MKNLSTFRKDFFVIIITLCLFISCKSPELVRSSTEVKSVSVTENYTQRADIEQFIKPYRVHIEKEMSQVLAYNPEVLVKSDKKLNAPIGNFMADASYEMVSDLFFKREGKTIDFVLLNWGGIRSDLPKGDITVGSAYRLMPFENKIVVIEMMGDKVLELAHYLARAKKPHPISKTVDLQIDRNGKIHQFCINGVPVEASKKYFVATSDYLMNGGDGMIFFKNPVKIYEIDYLIRNVLIDYFKKIDTLQATHDNRFIFVD